MGPFEFHFICCSHDILTQHSLELVPPLVAPADAQSLPLDVKMWASCSCTNMTSMFLPRAAVFCWPSCRPPVGGVGPFEFHFICCSHDILTRHSLELVPPLVAPADAQSLPLDVKMWASCSCTNMSINLPAFPFVRLSICLSISISANF